MGNEKLTDEQWEDVQDIVAGYSSDSQWRALVAEAKEYRALLATAWPCGWPAPTVLEQRGHGSVDLVQWESLDCDPIDPDEAEALGVGLIAAARRARGGAK
jgi:hypothetical protein